MGTIQERTWNMRTILDRRWLRNFLKCGLAGWCLEILFTSTESILAGDFRLMGKTSLFMFPIYGLGALLGPSCAFLDRWLESGMEGLGVVGKRDLFLRHGMIDMVLIFTAEYLFGALLTQLGICPWDYSEKRMNINGLIRLDFAPLWFLTGILFEQLGGYVHFFPLQRGNHRGRNGHMDQKV